MDKQKKGFTLVELIVVITILAILGTISFISLQGYSSQSRDSARVSDLNTMKTSLELFQLEAGKYPIPTNGTDITYSGGLVWTQGIFGESVFNNVDKLDKIPTDPLTNGKYTYSVTVRKNEYQISGITEADLTINILNNSYAGNIEATAIVTGNYNGQTVKSLSGTSVVTCNMLASPSIIANDIETSTDLAQIIASGSLVYDGYNNLPHSYKTSKFNASGGFKFEPSSTILAYTDTGSCNELTSKSNSLARLKLMKGLQEVYTGTIVKNIGRIKTLIAFGTININNTTPDIENYAASFVNNTLAGNVSLKSESSISDIEYTVTFDSQSGTSASPIIQNDGDAIGTLPTVTRSGYLFDGWFTLSSGGVEVTTGTLVDSDIIYYAQWTLICSCTYTQTAYTDNICTVSTSPLGYNGLKNSNDTLNCQSISGYGISCIDTSGYSHLTPYTKYTGYSDNGACN